MFVWPEQGFLLLLHNIGNSCVKLKFLSSPEKKCSMWPSFPKRPTFPRSECRCQAVAVPYKRTVSPLPYKLYHSLSPHPACSVQIHSLRAPAGTWACTREVLGLQPSSPLSSLWQLWSLTGPESSHPECSSETLEQDNIRGSPETHSQSK